MTDKRTILKSTQATKGSAFVIEARNTEVAGIESADCASTSLPDSTDQDGQAPRDAGNALAGEAVALEQAASEEERIIAEARKQAEGILGEAESKADEIKQQAVEEAAALRHKTEQELATQRESQAKELRRELEQEYSTRYGGAVKAIETAAADLREHKDDYVKQIEQPAYELVLAVARQVLGAELERSPGLVTNLIARAFEILKPEQVVTVQVNPATFHVLSEDDLLKQALARDGFRSELVNLEIDENLRPDQFIASVKGTSVNYDLEATLKEMLELLGKQAQAEQS